MQNFKSNQPGENENETRGDQWFQQKEWLQGWSVMPHSSVNVKLFKEQYFKAPERWDLMFRLLKTTDFGKLEPGRHEVDGDNLYFMVNQYVTREVSLVPFEVHRKYIDLQYVLKGEELIGTAASNDSTETESYNTEKDFALYSAKKSVCHKATPSEFLLFFPEELHQPGVQIKDPVPVKKIVFKIKNLSFASDFKF